MRRCQGSLEALHELRLRHEGCRGQMVDPLYNLCQFVDT